MIHITSSEDIPDLKGNKIVGQFKLENSKIIFTGSNNIVYFDGFSTLKRSNIFFMEIILYYTYVKIQY